jgi:uncharacterized protein (TIGR03000 family)
MTRARFLALAGLLALAGAALSQPPPPVADANKAYLRIYVPASARLEIEGIATRSTGEVRRFESPTLTPGKTYVYRLKATWTENGQPKSHERNIEVRPGRETEVDLRPGAAPPAAPGAGAGAGQTTTGGKPKLDVPYVPTPPEVVAKMLEMGQVKEGDVVWDLGCGDGRIVIDAVKKNKAKHGFGLDIDPDRIKEANENAKKAGVQDKVEFKVGNVFDVTSVADADVVCLYLLPEINLRLRPMLQRTLKPGARLVSHDFDMGDWKPNQTAEVTDSESFDHTVYLWTIPAGNRPMNEGPATGRPAPGPGTPPPAAAGKPKLYPVHGRVVVDGKPAGGAVVALAPTDAAMTDRPAAVTKEDGSFALATFKDNDGAPAGEYVVTVVWPTKADGAARPEDRLKNRYGDATKSSLRATVKPQDNELPPLELKTTD